MTIRPQVLLLAAVLWAAPAAPAKVTALQNGLAPSAEYAGCKDAWISDESYEKGRDSARSAVLRTGGKRHVLIRFDLSGLPAGQKVSRAVLRLADAGYPRPRADGTFASTLFAYAMTREWNDSANWLEHTRTDYKAVDAGDWKTPGGEYDLQTDFGRGADGLIASDALTAGPAGHVHELDVTPIVRRWLSGQSPNLGLLIKGERVELASADWPVPAGRPVLLIDDGQAGGGIEPPAAAPKDLALDAVAQTPDAGKPAGDYAAVRVGLHPSCGLRGRSTATYLKANQAVFPGPWGWMNQCRVGGVAGDFSRTLLYFDLGGIPAGASVKQARLVCSLVTQTARQTRSYRYGAFVVKLSDSPGWDGQSATALERKAGEPWPGEGGPAGCAGPLPAAIAAVTQQEVDDRGKMRKIDAGIEFDLTGVVRAWLGGKTPNCGIMLDNRIEGGSYDIYSAHALRPELRPYLELTISPPVEGKPAPAEPAPSAPAGDYWVAPMRAVHKQFTGKPGTLAQYGDSITVTMAYLANYSWSKKIVAKNMSPQDRAAADAVEKHADLTLWRTWKGGENGNTGMMKSDWLVNNIDAWQKKLQPEAAVIMFGTNDIGSLWPPEYTENMAASVRRMMRDGTVPMLTSIPPASRGGHHEYWLAAVAIARGLKVPLIDYQGEILRRRPEDWNGRLDKFAEFRKDVYGAPTLVSGDGTHPSNPKKWSDDFSDEALSHNGYNLRNYMTIRMYADVISKVFQSTNR